MGAVATNNKCPVIGMFFIIIVFLILFDILTTFVFRLDNINFHQDDNGDGWWQQTTGNGQQMSGMTTTVGTMVTNRQVCGSGDAIWIFTITVSRTDNHNGPDVMNRCAVQAMQFASSWPWYVFLYTITSIFYYYLLNAKPDIRFCHT
jgi:hypothetical protein